MNILIVGNGGREHALCWKVAQSPLVSQIYVAPGNAGTALEPRSQNIDIAATDIEGLVRFAKDNHIDFTIIGPEAPLVAGIVDTFTANQLRCFGPTAKAAALEGSKTFAKDFLTRHHIPTANYAYFTDPDQAKAYLKQQTFPQVIKADGLAAGKGVIITHTLSEATRAVDHMLIDQQFGSAGARILIEDFLQGTEASFIALVSNGKIIPFASSQDHKARFDGDKGPNTGGMGAYSPTPIVTPELHRRVMQTIIQPTVEGLSAQDIPYTGFLYAGLMIDGEQNPFVLEYNCRLGDPETQPLLLRLQSDLLPLLISAVEGELTQIDLTWDKRPALGVVMVADGYPGNYQRGEIIHGLEQKHSKAQKIFHAGTRFHEGNIVTDGGRVLCATALGNTYREAQHLAYQLVEHITWKGYSYRKDIGYRAIEQETSQVNTP